MSSAHARPSHDALKLVRVLCAASRHVAASLVSSVTASRHSVVSVASL